MRIMICVPGLPIELENIKGGVHSATLNLLNGCRELPIVIRVVVLTRAVKQAYNLQYSPNISMVYYPEGPFGYHTLNYLTVSPIWINKEIRQFKPNIIHYEEGNSFLLTRWLGIKIRPFLQTIHGMSIPEAKRKKKVKDKITWYFNGWIQKVLQPKNIIHLSEFSRQLHQHSNIKKETIIPNAIKKEYFNASIKDSTDNILVYIGIIDHNKNLLYLLETLSKLRSRQINYFLNIIGGFNNEAYKEIIEKYISENHLHTTVCFHGWITQSQVIRVLEKSDILVVCSKHESLPMVIAESMAAGKPVVASAVGGIPEMIDHGQNGYLFDLSIPQEIDEILSGLYNNHAHIGKLNIQARLKASRYESKTVAKQTISFYESLLQKHD